MGSNPRRIGAEGQVFGACRPGGEAWAFVDYFGKIDDIAGAVAGGVGVGDVLGDELLAGGGMGGQRAGEVQESVRFMARLSRCWVNAGLTVDG